MSEDQVPARRIGRRRRRANVSGGRQLAHQVVVTDAEEILLVQRAEAQKVSVARLLVESALSEAGETPSQRLEAMTELFALRRLLAAVSNNVNQVARHANAGEDFPADAAGALAGVRRVVARLDAAIDGLSDTSRAAAGR